MNFEALPRFAQYLIMLNMVLDVPSRMMRRSGVEGLIGLLLMPVGLPRPAVRSKPACPDVRGCPILNNMDYTHAVWTALGGNLVMLAVLAWLGKWWLKRYADDRLQKLKDYAETERAKLVIELTSKAKTDEIKFEWVHDKRAAAILEITKRFADIAKRLQLLHFMFDALPDYAPHVDAPDMLASHVIELREFYLCHIPCLTESLCGNILSTLEPLELASSNFTIMPHVSGEHLKKAKDNFTKGVTVGLERIENTVNSFRIELTGDGNKKSSPVQE